MKEILNANVTFNGRREVILLTDGSVGNTAEVIGYVNQHNKNSRVFCVGIGSGCSTALVNGISQAANGKSIFVTTDERIQAKVMEIAGYTTRPSLVMTQIAFGIKNFEKIVDGPGINEHSSVPIYDNVRCLYNIRSKKMTQFFKKNEGAKIEVNMTFEAEDTVYNETKYITCTKTDDKSYSNFLSFWCSQKIQEIKKVHSEEYGDLSDNHKTQIIELSKKGNVLHELTAFIGVSSKQNKLLQSLESEVLCESDSMDFYGMSSTENIYCGASYSPPSYASNYCVPDGMPQMKSLSPTNSTSFDVCDGIALVQSSRPKKSISKMFKSSVANVGKVFGKKKKSKKVKMSFRTEKKSSNAELDDLYIEPPMLSDIPCGKMERVEKSFPGLREKTSFAKPDNRLRHEKIVSHASVSGLWTDSPKLWTLLQSYHFDAEKLQQVTFTTIYSLFYNYFLAKA